MKKLYILAVGLFFALAACNKDKSTFADRQIPAVVVSGLKDTFNVFTFRDFLTINPTVQNESQFDYYWTMFSANFRPGQGLVIPDTLAKTKDLNYEMKANPGPYILVFNVRDKETGVTKLINMTLNVTTLNMNGWYLLKSNAGKTDFDFFNSVGRIDNWIAYYNDGKSLDGDAVKAIFSPGFKSTLTSPDIYNGLVVLSTNDIGIYRVDNGKMIMNFDNMFFNKPAVRKPEAAFQAINAANLGLVNDGKAYAMSKGALFSNMPPTKYTKISPLTASAAMDIGFDQDTKSMLLFNGANFQDFGANAGDTLKKPNANLIWMAGYTGSRSNALMLFRNPKDTGYLYKIDAHYGQLNGSGTLFMAKDTLKPEHGLMKASIITGNYDSDYIYYVVGSNVYLTDVATTTEQLQFTLPAGETVTSMQHVKYPQPLSVVPFTTDVLAIATYNNGHYKVYLHKISSTGSIQAIATPNFEGEGRVNTVIYMEQGNGSRIF